MLEARIKKTFRGFSLNIELNAGNETMALLGASGAGKTMTLKCLAGIERPDSGRIAVDGQVWFDSESKICLSPQERSTGLLFQNYALFPNMTVLQNLVCGLRRETPRKEREKEARRLLERFCLTGLEHHLPSQLSGGQQQRVALARCLARKPKLLLLDEPFAALDTHLRWQLEQELGDTLDMFAGTTLYVTHDREETLRLCGRVCVVQAGRSQSATPVWEWYHQPATRSAAHLAGFENILSAKLGNDGRVHLPDMGFSMEYPEKEAEAAAFRASSVRLGERQEEFAVSCRIVRSTEQELIVSPLQHPTSLIRALPDKRYSVGEVVWLNVPRTKIIWLKKEEAACLPQR